MMQTDIQQVEIVDEVSISRPHTMYDSVANDFYDVYIIEISSESDGEPVHYRFALNKNIAEMMFKDNILPVRSE